MKISVDENRNILLEEIYSGIGLKAPAGEYLGICMRDGGFEFNYGGEWYRAKDGVITKRKEDRRNIIPQDAVSLEVFCVKEKEAYIGFKISNGDFHFIQVPYTELERRIGNGGIANCPICKKPF